MEKHKLIKNRKKRSPKEIIESDKYSFLESHYSKIPGQEMIPTSTRREEGQVFVDKGKITKLLKKFGSKEYIDVHTHPEYFFTKGYKGSPIPSSTDIKYFLRDKHMRSMVIAQRDINTEKIRGYVYLRKRNTPKKQVLKIPFLGNLLGKPKWEKSKREKNFLEEEYSASQNTWRKYGNSTIKLKALENLKKYGGINYRFVPAKHYKFDKDTLRFVFSQKGDLEKRVIVSIITASFLGGLFFLSNNITGNAVANLSNNFSNLIGRVLFLLGILGTLFYFRRKKHP